MNTLDWKKLLLGSSLLVSGLVFAQPAFAQENDEDLIIEVTPEQEEDEEEDTVVVTGSRIKRDTFSSIQPLQVISVDTSIKAGLIDPAQILQQDESAAGQQIDATFNGFVLDNGPGSQTLNLRGLNPNRTLVLLNGRRLAPSGVEGAPISASINTIPGSLVERYDLLLDGASSVYGSDAVAGVANVVLRKDFDGFELIGQADLTEQGSNSDYTVAGVWGGNNDRGFIGIGVEYDYRDEVKLADRDFLNDCEKHVEIDQNGNIRHRDVVDEIRFSEWFGGFQAADGDGPLGECVVDGISGRVFERSNTFGSIYNVGGTTTNIGIPGYVDQTIAGVPIDADGDGVQDFGFQEFSVNGTVLDSSFISEQKRASVMAYGEYTLEGEANLTPFFEVLYTDSRVFADAGQPLLFPEVGPNNPFNPCRFVSVDTNCGSNQFNFDAAFNSRWNAYQRDRDPNRDGDNRDSRICARIGVPIDPATGQYRYDLATGPFDNAGCTPFIFGYGPGDFVGPTQTVPIVGVRGDRDQVNATQKNLRLNFGLRGDLSFLSEFGSLSDWSFETSVNHSNSNGFSSRKGILENRLNFALGIDPNAPLLPGNVANETPGPCIANPGSPVSADVSNGCVPVNLFADSLARNTVGDFATAAERDYLFGDRTFETIYKQTVWNAFATGNILELPAGNLAAVLGAEVRVDEIDSNPSDIARDGLFFGFFSDSGADGKKTTKEIFAELDIPLVADKQLFKQLDFNVSGRLTNDEFYGTNYTYSAKAGWRPVESLLMKGSVGTSFRAPNLRENFLLGQSGFNNFFDPCVVPGGARATPIGGGPDVYNPLGDQREADVIARCQAEGVDPFALGLNTGITGFTNAEITRSGSLDLNPETSRSITAGFSFEQPFFDAFDLTVNVNYYRIEVNDSLIEPTGQFLVNECYSNPRSGGARSPFCDRVIRDAQGFIDLLDAGFANISVDLVRGFDYNIDFDYEFQAFDRPMDFGIQFRANQLLNRRFEDVDDDGNRQIDDLEGEFGFPYLTGTSRFFLEVDNKWTAAWTTRFVGEVEQDSAGVDSFANAFGVDLNNDGFVDQVGDTCGGPFVGDVNCRDVGFTDSYWVHSASLSYEADTWRITAGVANLFNTEPPEVDGTEVFSISNVPIGNGYDLDGRRFFISGRKTF